MKDDALTVTFDVVLMVAETTAPFKDVPEASLREMFSNEHDVMITLLEATMTGRETVATVEGVIVTDVRVNVPEVTDTML